ncbi:MAG: DinB family protein [Candidatus Krumholzibacteriia bacterium]
MSARVPWTERTFHFDFPAELYRELLERLRGTPARVEDRLGSFPNEIRTRRDGDRWSIQENVGHLLDTETLFSGRLDDYEARVDVLRAADMQNAATWEARHNDKPIEAILSAFRQKRRALVARLEQLEPERFSQSILHPRLNEPMRIVDMMLLQAEHDDYHLARISELGRRLGA